MSDWVSQHPKALPVCSLLKCHSTVTALLYTSQTVVVCLCTVWPVCSAFDKIDLNILITGLWATFGCSSTVLDWFISHISCHAQSVFVGHESTPSVLKSATGFCCRTSSLVFMYTHPLSTVICQSRLSYNFFADDSQLKKSSVPSDFTVLACCLKDCIEDVAQWMSDIKLKMNDDKPEPMAIGTRSKIKSCHP